MPLTNLDSLVDRGLRGRADGGSGGKRARPRYRYAHHAQQLRRPGQYSGAAREPVPSAAGSVAHDRRRGARAPGGPRRERALRDADGRSATSDIRCRKQKLFSPLLKMTLILSIDAIVKIRRVFTLWASMGKIFISERILMKFRHRLRPKSQSD